MSRAVLLLQDGLQTKRCVPHGILSVAHTYTHTYHTLYHTAAMISRFWTTAHTLITRYTTPTHILSHTITLPCSIILYNTVSNALPYSLSHTIAQLHTLSPLPHHHTIRRTHNHTPLEHNHIQLTTATHAFSRATADCCD